MNSEHEKALHYLNANLHLLTLERTGWRRWIFGRWLYRSEPFRNDIARVLEKSEFPVPIGAERLWP